MTTIELVPEQLPFSLEEEMPDTAALLNEVMAEDDANDPLLENYQRFATEQR